MQFFPLQIQNGSSLTFQRAEVVNDTFFVQIFFRLSDKAKILKKALKPSRVKKKKKRPPPLHITHKSVGWVRSIDCYSLGYSVFNIPFFPHDMCHHDTYYSSAMFGQRLWRALLLKEAKEIGVCFPDFVTVAHVESSRNSAFGDYDSWHLKSIYWVLS